MIKAIRHVGLVVNDLERALNFWCDVMGFSISKTMEEAGPQIDAMMGLVDVELTTVKLIAPEGGQMLELLKFHSHSNKSFWDGTPFTTGFTHLAITVDDMDETCERLKNAGVAFPAGAQVSADGSVKVIYATGPENVLIELVEILS